jgi:hypothetical protein
MGTVTPYTHVVVWTMGNRKVGVVCPDYQTAEVLQEAVQGSQLVLLLDQADGEALMRAAQVVASRFQEFGSAQDKLTEATRLLEERVGQARNASIPSPGDDTPTPA